MISFSKQQGETHDFSPNTNRKTKRYKPANISQKINKNKYPKQILQKPTKKLQNTTITKLYNQSIHETQTDNIKEPQPHKKH